MQQTVQQWDRYLIAQNAFLVIIIIIDTTLLLATIAGNFGLLLPFLVFLACDSIYAIAHYMLSPVRVSVCRSACHTGGSVKHG